MNGPCMNGQSIKLMGESGHISNYVESGMGSQSCTRRIEAKPGMCISLLLNTLCYIQNS